MAATNFGFNSLITVAIQENGWNTQVNDADARLPVVYEASANTIKRVTEPTTPTRLHGSTSPVKNVQGMVRAEGDVTLYIHETDLAFWIRQMLNAEQADVTTVRNDEEEVISETAYGTATPPDDGYEITISSLSQPNDIFTSPIVSGKLYITFADFGTGGSILERKVAIKGRDHTEERLSETITFTPAADNSLVASGSYTTDTDTDIDEVATSRSYGRLKFTFDASADYVSGSTAGSIKVRGNSTSGHYIGETIDITAAGVGTTEMITKNVYDLNEGDITYTIIDIENGEVAISMSQDVLVSSYHYDSISSFNISTGINDEKYAIESNPESYKHTIGLSSNVLDGLTMEIRKGDVPNTYHGMIVTGGTLTLAESVTLALSMVGRDGDLYYNMEGGTSPSAVDTFRRPGSQLASDWGMAVQLDLENQGNFVAKAVSDATFTFNNNIDFPEARFKGDRHYEKPVRKGDREVGMTFTIDYEEGDENNIDRRGLGDEFGVNLIVANKAKGGTYNGLEFNIPVAELSGFSDPDVPDQTEILRSVEVRGFSKSVTGEDEVEVVVYAPDAEVL